MNRDYEIELGIKITFSSEAPADLQGEINAILSQWSDGRKPFPVEMMEDGLAAVLRIALHEVVSREVRLRHELPRLGDVRRAREKQHQEVAKALDTLSLHVRETVCCGISEVLSEVEGRRAPEIRQITDVVLRPGGVVEEPKRGDLGLIAPDPNAGVPGRYSVIHVDLNAGRASVVGRELPLGAARQVAASPDFSFKLGVEKGPK